MRNDCNETDDLDDFPAAQRTSRSHSHTPMWVLWHGGPHCRPVGPERARRKARIYTSSASCSTKCVPPTSPTANITSLDLLTLCRSFQTHIFCWGLYRVSQPFRSGSDQNDNMEFWSGRSFGNVGRCQGPGFYSVLFIVLGDSIPGRYGDGVRHATAVGASVCTDPHRLPVWRGVWPVRFGSLRGVRLFCLSSLDLLCVPQENWQASNIKGATVCA